MSGLVLTVATWTCWVNYKMTGHVKLPSKYIMPKITLKHQICIMFLLCVLTEHLFLKTWKDRLWTYIQFHCCCYECFMPANTSNMLKDVVTGITFARLSVFSKRCFKLNYVIKLVNSKFLSVLRDH